MQFRSIYLIIFLALVGFSINGYSQQNVGIGITTPAELLHVNGISLHEGLKVDINNGGTVMYINPNDGAGNFHRYWNTLGGTAPVRVSDGIAYDEYMNSTITNSTASNYQMRYGGFGAAGSAITWSPGFSVNYDNGYFGIKTNTPAHALDVDGNARFQGNNIYGGTGNFRIHAGPGGYVELKTNSTAYGVVIRDVTNSNFGNIEVENNTLAIGYRVSTGHIFVEQGGNVGIGVANPTTKFDVNGVATVDYLAVDPQNTTGEGGEIQLKGSPGKTTWQIDNLNGDVRMHAGGGEWFVMNNAGKLSLSAGKAFPGNYKLYVRGGILSERVKVAVYNSGDWADYVFAEDYDLKSLPYVEQFVKQNKHLPNVPSAAKMVEKGNDLGKTDALLLEKIEELFLHTIEQQKQIEQLQAEIERMKAE